MTIKLSTYTTIKSMNKPSLYADPLAWAIVDFSSSLIDQMGNIDRAHIGLIVVSDECSLTTMRILSATSKQGKISPLKFAGANPGVVAGLTAIQYGLRGPSLVLTMDPINAAAAITATARYWINYNNTRSVLIITHQKGFDSEDVLMGSCIADTEILCGGNTIRGLCKRVRSGK